ncbi:glycosyltransferase family 4 protein [Oxynema aestuarii]|nr:glycosyltransferase family 4 protein [Oxynema aestuarii]
MLISSAIPQNTTAGELILYRHLSQVPELNLIIATDKYAFSSDEDPLDIQVNRFIIRLQKTRFSRFVNDVHQCLHPFFNYDKLRKSIAKHKPDLILTVAEGTYWIAAQRMAREFNIPLVSIFHDWWPDLAYVHSWARRILENRFKQLYRQSQLAFCVSEEMRQLLGTHPNAQLLYPIPDQLVAAAETHTLSTGKQFKLVYAGRLSGISGQTIQALCTSLQGVTGLQLKLFGPQPDWSDAFLQPLKEQGIYGGFISRDRLRQEFNAASALLVAIPFDGSNRRWAETSFPSKLVEYCKFQKPIIIWGPEYCSAVRWGCKHQAVLVVTSPLLQDLKKAVKELANQPEEQKRLGNKALEMAQGMFNPEKIQRHFVESLYQLANQKLEKTTYFCVKLFKNVT